MINTTLKREVRKEKKLIFYKREKCTNFYIEVELEFKKKKIKKKIGATQAKYVRSQEIYQIIQI
jgi:hypothetical protein